jgi:hypothetical protein
MLPCKPTKNLLMNVDKKLTRTGELTDRRTRGLTDRRTRGLDPLCISF